jgi:hypothetical protein
MFLNSIGAHPNLQAFDVFNGDMKSIFSSQDVYAPTDRLGWALSTLPKWPPHCDMHCLPHQNLTLSLLKPTLMKLTLRLEVLNHV